MNEILVSVGSTNLRCLPLGVGTWSWGNEGGWGFGSAYTEKDLRKAFEESVNGGVSLFDTAEKYGNGLSESLLGKFLRNSDQRIFVATKFSPTRWDIRRKDLVKALDASLKRLGLAKVALYQLHWPSRFVSVERRMDALAEVVEKDLTEAIGVSNFSLEQMQRAQERLAKRSLSLASIQVNYSLLQRAPERNGILEECRHLGVTLLAYSPLAMGVLTGKYSSQNPLPGVRGGKYSIPYLEHIRPLIQLLKEIGDGHERKTPTQVALNWLMCKGAFPIPGAKTGKQARENIGALGWRLTEKEISALDTASQAVQVNS